LLSQNKEGETALHLAAKGNHTQILEKLLAWAQEAQLNSNKVKKKLLLAKDKYGYTAWNVAAEGGNVEALEILKSWAKETELNPEKLLVP
jgi:ankyrin repeat protein